MCFEVYCTYKIDAQNDEYSTWVWWFLIIILLLYSLVNFSGNKNWFFFFVVVVGRCSWGCWCTCLILTWYSQHTGSWSIGTIIKLVELGRGQNVLRTLAILEIVQYKTSKFLNIHSKFFWKIYLIFIC